MNYKKTFIFKKIFPNFALILIFAMYYIVAIILLYVFYRFFMSRAINNITNKYLQNEKQKFFDNNPHLNKKTKNEFNNVDKTFKINKLNKSK